MHPLFQKATGLTETIVTATIEVHRDKGPGLIESIYEWCLLHELGLRGLACISQKSILIHYKGFIREEPLRFDVLAEGCVLVEAKAVEKILPIHMLPSRLISPLSRFPPVQVLMNRYGQRRADAIKALGNIIRRCIGELIMAG